MNQLYSKNKNIKDQKTFYFYNSLGNYTGYSAKSLIEFAQKSEKLPLESLKFHLFREDFEKWIDTSLKEAMLAKRVGSIRRQKIDNENLRNQLCQTVLQHIKFYKNSRNQL